MSWKYYKDTYYSIEDAVKHARKNIPTLCADAQLPTARIEAALAQIAMAEAYIDKVMNEAFREDDE